MTGIRQDLAKLGGGWSDPILWYARAVSELKKRPFDDRTSWRFLAAIHGINPRRWTDLQIFAPGEADFGAIDTSSVLNQCQHSTWFFLPWHRGYLWAFEAIVASTIAGLGGPKDWTLPYWNYLDAASGSARAIPQPFLDAAMPDGSPNPLRAPRAGLQRLGAVPGVLDDISLRAQKETFFTAQPRTIGYGGGVTGFAHRDRNGGAAELNPHNAVHVMIGGWRQDSGYMSDPNFAALDPIFWLHHCNIDRLWAAWMAHPGNIQETGKIWAAGPSPQRFELPKADGNLAIFQPGAALPGGPLCPVYDDLSSGTGFTIPNPLEIQQEPPTMAAGAPPVPHEALLAGEGAGGVTVASAAVADMPVSLAPPPAVPAGVSVNFKVLLNLENIKGTVPSGILRVSLQTQAPGAIPAGADLPNVQSVPLFGLEKASTVDGGHDGNGLSVILDVTEEARAIGLDSGAGLDQVTVRIEQPAETEGPPISIEKISLYRQQVD